MAGKNAKVKNFYVKPLHGMEIVAREEIVYCFLKLNQKEIIEYFEHQSRKRG